MEKYKKAYWFIPVALVLFAIITAIVMLLWNWIIPSVFGLQTITYWQSGGLIILSRILFGSLWKGHRGFGGERGDNFKHKSHMHEKWLNMTEEERNEFISRRRAHFHGHSFDDKGFHGKRSRYGTNEKSGESNQ